MKYPCEGPHHYFEPKNEMRVIEIGQPCSCGEMKSQYHVKLMEGTKVLEVSQSMLAWWRFMEGGG